MATTITLKTYPTQTGHDLASEWIYQADDGRWYHEGIACYSSSHLGMGTCRCETHEVAFSEPITAEWAEHLRDPQPCPDCGKVSTHPAGHLYFPQGAQ